MARLRKGERDAVRARLLETAARHFAATGFKEASIDAISLAAGCAKGTIYNYFRSKDELVGAVLDESARRAAERFAAGDTAGRDTRGRLTALAEADVAVLREHEDFYKVVIREALSFRPEAQSAALGHLAPFLAAVVRILADGRQRGEITSERSNDELALLFVGLLALLYGQRWASAGAWPPLEMIPDLVADFFLNGARGKRQR
jgi:AcrR family transcriptional regulator